MQALIAWGLTALGGSFIGSYVASYLKKKGENRAIREDLDDLLKQVRAVTTTTKEIEAKISTDVWDRQKRWEMKRDVLFEAMKSMGAVTDALVGLGTAFDVYRLAKENGGPRFDQLKLEASTKWSEAAEKFDATILLMSLVGGEEARDECDGLSLLVREMAGRIFAGTPRVLDDSKVELAKKKLDSMKAIRKDLETDKPG
jgi:hypothetical protein